MSNFIHYQVIEQKAKKNKKKQQQLHNTHNKRKAQCTKERLLVQCQCTAFCVYTRDSRHTKVTQKYVGADPGGGSHGAMPPNTIERFLMYGF